MVSSECSSRRSWFDHTCGLQSSNQSSRPHFFEATCVLYPGSFPRPLVPPLLSTRTVNTQTNSYSFIYCSKIIQIHFLFIRHYFCSWCFLSIISRYHHVIYVRTYTVFFGHWPHGCCTGPTQNVILPLYNEGMREHRHVLTFEVPGLEPGEDLHSAQLRLTLAFVDWQHQLQTGMCTFHTQ